MIYLFLFTDNHIKMLKIGQRNTLQVVELFPFGYALNDLDHSLDAPVFLKDTSVALHVDDEVDVFIFTQADGSLLASITSPKIMLHEFAALTLVGESAHGCFFDWGISPDLYAPEGQLHGQLDIGNRYIVRLVQDKLGKLVATTKIERFLNQQTDSLKINQAVSLLIYGETPLGYKAIIDNTYQGLLFKSDLITRVKVGDRINGFIKHIRQDGKLDLSLQAITNESRKSLEQLIIDDLEAHDGLSTLTDKSSPDEIFARFSVSKAAYKRAIGALYKAKKIRIEQNCLYLNSAQG